VKNLSEKPARGKEGSEDNLSEGRIIFGTAAKQNDLLCKRRKRGGGAENGTATQDVRLKGTPNVIQSHQKEKSKHKEQLGRGGDHQLGYISWQIRKNLGQLDRT